MNSRVKSFSLIATALLSLTVVGVHAAPVSSATSALSGRFVSKMAAVRVNPHKIPSVAGRIKEYPVMTYTPVSKIDTLNENRLADEISYGVYMIENSRGENGRRAYSCQDRAFAGALVGKALFAICDGHGTYGERIAQEVIKKFPLDVLKHKNSDQAIAGSCAQIQEQYRKMSHAQRSGTTLVCGVIQDKKLTVGNAGDSRLVLIRPSRSSIVLSTTDHKGDQKRTGLALSRSLGDVEAHQKYGLTARPDVSQIELEDGDLIVLASDGYWDVLTNQQTASLVFQGLNQGLDCKDLAKMLAEKAHGLGSRDDISVLCVRYKKTSA